jgi:guanine deaminase
MLTPREQYFLNEAITLSKEGMLQGKGGPFGCVIVKDDAIIGRGCNNVLSSNDPTAHAEIAAIREACKHLGSFQLTGCVVYASCEPCPMCLGAIYWARPTKVIYANTRTEAAAIQFDDAFIYEEIQADAAQRKIPFIHHPSLRAKEVFSTWATWEGRQLY